MSTYRCNECEKDFGSRAALDMHNKDKHGIKVPRNDDDDDYFTEADYQTWMRL